MKPASIHAARAYLVRRLYAKLSLVTDDWMDVVRSLALGIFASDLKPSQVIALSGGVPLDYVFKEDFDKEDWEPIWLEHFGTICGK